MLGNQPSSAATRTPYPDGQHPGKGPANARQSPYDAILVEFNLRSEGEDSALAGMGLELIRGLRASGTKASLVVFTAMDGEVYETMSREAGADDFIQKVAGMTRLHEPARKIGEDGCRSGAMALLAARGGEAAIERTSGLGVQTRRIRSTIYMEAHQGPIRLRPLLRDI